MSKVLLAGALVLLIAGLVAAGLLAGAGKPKSIRSRGTWQVFSAPESLEGPFIAWLKELGFSAVDDGFRGPSGTQTPMTVHWTKTGGEMKVGTSWTFEGSTGEEEKDEEQAWAFNEKLKRWRAERP